MNLVAWSFRLLKPLALLVSLVIPSLDAAYGQKFPYNPDFPEAEYPYAARPNGCGSSVALANGRISMRPEWIRDTWGPVDFRSSCDRHDRCYFRGPDRASCDAQLFDDLRASCERDLLKASKPWLAASLQTCYGLALTYAAGAAAFGEGSFNMARTEQRSYEDWLTTLPQSHRLVRFP